MPKETGMVIEVAGREVHVTNPDKVFFPQAGYTKLDLVQYYLAVGEGALRGVAGRPVVLKRYVNGIEEEPFFQKRPHRMAQDLRLAWDPCECADRATLELRRGPASRPGAGQRSRAAGPGHRDQRMVEGRAARRVHRLQPERQGPDSGLGVVGAPGA